MKLYVNGTSPYARKVLVVVREKGLDSAVETVLCDPWSDPAALLAVNPLSKVPALDLEDGTTLVDSDLIAEWLDASGPAPRLLAPIGPARWRALRLAALARGVTDAAFAAVLEGRRPEAERSATWVSRQTAALRRAVPALEKARFPAGEPEDPERFDLGDIGLAVALAYLDFRHAALGWRSLAPRLADWYDEVGRRPSMQATAFG